MRTNRLTLSFLVVPLLAGCSSFNREWRAALQEPYPAAGLSGPWEGRWVSDVNGQNDKLRCVITENATNVSAHFHATYKHVFHFGYTVPLKAEPGTDGYSFSGEADLGKMAGGVYTYAGKATGTNFVSTYQSKYDHGKFEMTRPANATAAPQTLAPRR